MKTMVPLERLDATAAQTMTSAGFWRRNTVRTAGSTPDGPSAKILAFCWLIWGSMVKIFSSNQMKALSPALLIFSNIIFDFFFFKKNHRKWTILSGLVLIHFTNQQVKYCRISFISFLVMSRNDEVNLSAPPCNRTSCSQLADEYAAEFLAHLDGYTGRVEGAFRQSLGRCGPLSNVYNATDVTLCSNVVYPFVSSR